LALIWTAWNNGSHHSSGAGYGFRIAKQDRDRYMVRTWRNVTIQLPAGSGSMQIVVNIDNDSIWEGSCQELRSKEIGRWLRIQRLAPWPRGSPPRFRVEAQGDGMLGVAGPA